MARYGLSEVNINIYCDIDVITMNTDVFSCGWTLVNFRYCSIILLTTFDQKKIPLVTFCHFACFVFPFFSGRFIRS